MLAPVWPGTGAPKLEVQQLAAADSLRSQSQVVFRYKLRLQKAQLCLHCLAPSAGSLTDTGGWQPRWQNAGKPWLRPQHHANGL